ncbi:MAG: homocysteine S-methyltransferase family protein [Armatimonadota bacterium]
MSLLARVASGDILVSDGAMGTMLQAHGLKPGECPEEWCVSHPDVVKGITRAYVEAGSDIVLTNSFGGTAPKLSGYGFEGRVREFAHAAVQIALEAASGRAIVAASVGPTGLGHLLEPYGDVQPDQVRSAFREQISALAEAGAHALCIETMMSLDEAALAVQAAKECCDLPVIATMTFEKGARGYRTMMGTSPAQAAQELPGYGADIIGANCGNGIAEMVEITAEMRHIAPDIPILIHANAGVPELRDGMTVFRETPEDMASRVPDLVKAGANIVGGCCGTTPDHIRAMAEAVRRLRA